MVRFILGAGAEKEPVPVRPIIKFSSPEEFRTRHETATKAEYKEEKRRVDAFNSLNPVLDAWVITAPPSNKTWMGYIFRVDLNCRLPKGVDPPGIDQSCELRLSTANDTHSDWYFCRRGAEVVPLNQSWSKLTELVVYAPYDMDSEEKFAEDLVPLLNGALPVRSLHKDKARKIKVQLHQDASMATMLAELGALDRLMSGKASKAGAAAFSYLMDFNPTEIFDLTSSFPHLADLDEIPDAEVRAALRDITEVFDEDQRRAYVGLNALPERIFFVPGGPGAGKTWWALNVALLAQSGSKGCKVLYLVDINKPVDDAANRMYTMCGKPCFEKSVVRVAGWPLTGKDADQEDNDDEDCDNMGEEDKFPRALSNANFTEGFLCAMEPILPRDMEKAPTLDEKAWEVYSDQPEKYNEVDLALDHLFSAERTGQSSRADMKLLRKSLLWLYYDVFNQADFIATTPVTAPRLAGLFSPRLIIFDECAHARELSTMIALAHFAPKAWFYVGDHRQTEPFVEASYQEYSKQLKLSTMERAEMNEAISHQLLVNHRAYGGLERLASELFYNGAMRSEKEDDELEPPSVRHLRQWLSNITIGETKATETIRVPRLIISHEGAMESTTAGTSSSNYVHQQFVMQQVEILLNDRAFLQVGSSEAGTIMILSPYKQAVFNYQGAVNRLPSRQMKRRVQVRTVDTAQGQEADVVFLDMVRSRASTHTDNSKRLCVALTRARQAEVIMMRESMATTSGFAMKGELPVYLRQLWSKCRSGEEGTVLRYSPTPAKARGGGGGWGAPDDDLLDSEDDWRW